AGINLNIFNKRSDVVVMANIAQLVNVLQSVILTEGKKMILTPTYHVFEMYKEHQDAVLLDSFIETNPIGTENYTVPNLHESVSMDSDGRINITLCNLSVDESYKIDAEIIGMKVNNITGRVLTGDMAEHNTFEEPDRVKPKEFSSFSITEKGFYLEIPAVSVVSLSLN
ncbi:MAG TPA: alpha-L-arabinofuranosidase C-terminal domain-containing protein, partial [Clostridia bacterium]